MNISLDFDGTYTEAPELWNRFIAQFRNAGHKVYCITMRKPEECADVESSLSNRVDAIHYTSREGKISYCLKHGLKVDVWIDDQPHFITGGALI